MGANYYASLKNGSGYYLHYSGNSAVLSSGQLVWHFYSQGSDTWKIGCKSGSNVRYLYFSGSNAYVTESENNAAVIKRQKDGSGYKFAYGGQVLAKDPNSYNVILAPRSADNSQYWTEFDKDS